MRHVRWIIVAAAAVLAASGGCGSAGTATGDSEAGSAVVTGSSAVDEPAPAAAIEIAEQGYTEIPTSQYQTTIYTPFAAIFRNPDSKRFADAQVRFVFKDDAGTVVGTQQDYLTAVFPGGTAALSGVLSDVSGVKSMEVQVLPGATEEAPQGTSAFVVDQVNTVKEQYGGYKTTAQVTSPFAKDLSDIRATAVYRNTAGAIMGGDFTFVSFIPGMGTTGLEIPSFHDYPESPAATEVYLSLSSLTLLSDG